jgi:hypothetical protein
MPTSAQIDKALKQVINQESFFKVLLAATLDWPTSDVTQIDDIAYGWSQQDLSAAGLEKHLVEGSIWQLQPSSTGQPWGIFVLEFRHEDSLSPRRGLAGTLRKVLKGLVGARRKDPNLPSWKREHLLFICTYKWTHFRFAYYRSKPDEPRSARLTTFGWSPDTSNRTVVEFNLPPLAWPGDTSDAEGWVNAWAKAFDKEPLTKDFFRRFDNALDAIKADLEKYQQLSSAEAYTQSQLLLERLIFLYFLQNRGWLNQDRQYLPSPLGEHSKNPDGFTYYHDFLDKLFWTLSTAPLGAGRLPGIPFLNGGLFDDDEFQQTPNRKTNPPLKVRNKTMQYVFGELLEAFNFTVTEDTPLNQEVAVDPEMLGKVFESIVLHAEAADPDAIAPDKRKATGSYYTPRIVVHFICREVLYQYLLGHLPGDDWGPRLKGLLYFEHSDGFDEDEKELLKRTITPDQARKVLELVKPLKCCDPAVGSGAFPVGLMQELVNLRRLLETVLNGYRDPVVSLGSTWLHDAKAHIVENCLFGVDIQQQAIEICRLRLWLSLVVDYDLGLDPFNAEHRQFMEAIDRMSQLPNLEMNFHRGDSLHDHISGVPVVILADRASRHTAEFAAIAKLGADLHKAKKSERKKKLRLDILDKRLQLSRKIVDDELQILRQRDSALDTLFGDEDDSDAEKRKRNRREIEHLEQALKKIGTDQSELERLRRREADPQFYPKLRKLEGADFDSPFNFAWSIDFPGIFASESKGFDIIVGNPPFVTARNPSKRELWRSRWPRVCVGTYQLVCPFFELGFGLLRSSGELGFIVSNAFAKRGFGKPLVEKFLSTVEVQKIVDCSGLLFPGHGTPTCLVFGAGSKPNREEPIRVAAILPGGGDLRTPPEESPLWTKLAAHHDTPGYLDEQIVVADVPRSEMRSWPWNFDSSARPAFELLVSSKQPLSKFLGAYGSMFDTHKDDVFMPPVDLIRRFGIEANAVASFAIGDAIRNWNLVGSGLVLRPYDAQWSLRKKDGSRLFKYLQIFRRELGSRAVFAGGTYDEAGEPWYRYHQMSVPKITAPYVVVYPEIATHGHFIVHEAGTLFTQTAPLVILRNNGENEHLLLAALLNSSAALFVLKQICFNKGAGEDEHRDRFEFAGAKVQQVPVPPTIAIGLSGGSHNLASALIELARSASDLGRVLRTWHFHGLFAKDGEAYGTSYACLPNGNQRNSAIRDFTSSSELASVFSRAQEAREETVQRLTALQEEMDWALYSAFELLPENSAACNVCRDPDVLDRDDRPFRLWQRASGEYKKALQLIPHQWAKDRRLLWSERLSAIRDNEHIRRIEQPVYKRRWDEQWKIGNEWRRGQIAYSAEFVEAFEWWLKEKAEWWLEHKTQDGPAETADWAQAVWKDKRVQAAWPVAAEQYAFLDHEKAREKAEDERPPIPAPPKTSTDFLGFSRKFRQLIDEETVPAGFPFGTDYEQVAKSLHKPIPPQLKKVRGKLNVPRERFHLIAADQYQWAGLQFK